MGFEMNVVFKVDALRLRDRRLSSWLRLVVPAASCVGLFQYNVSPVVLVVLTTITSTRDRQDT